MIEALGKWIVTICVAIFFTTAVQMILPDNSLKKYCNFVLGLIIFVVMITPIVNLFNSDIEINKLIEESATAVFNNEGEADYHEYRQDNINATLETFKAKLEKQCVEDLKKNFKGDEYSANFNVTYDEENTLFNIDSVEISVNYGGIERVKDIRIGEESVAVQSTDDELGQVGVQLKEFVSNKYDIDRNKVYIFKTSEKETN